MGLYQKKFYTLLKERHPTVVRGVEEARSVSTELVDKYFEESLLWAVNSFGEDILVDIADSYAGYTMEVNRAQFEYERTGKYQVSTFSEANELVYQQSDYMKYYYWGVFAILFCWSHYVELMDFYLKRFVERLPSGRLIEIAPGHGAWGILAVNSNHKITLEGWDISPTSIEMAPLMAAGANVQDRCTYKIADATKLNHSDGQFDAAICSFMLEHLEQPESFLTDFAPALKSGALAYVTLALTAAQTDHIYEFKHESEAILMAEKAGFELLECKIARPKRLMPNARFVPRVQAMILRKL